MSPIRNQILNLTRILGHFLLTKLLLPALLRGKETSPDKHARVISTSSLAAYLFDFDFDTFKDTPQRRKRGTHELYSQSKLVCLSPYSELSVYAYNLSVSGQCTVRARTCEAVWPSRHHINFLQPRSVNLYVSSETVNLRHIF